MLSKEIFTQSVPYYTGMKRQEQKCYFLLPGNDVQGIMASEYNIGRCEGHLKNATLLKKTIPQVGHSPGLSPGLHLHIILTLETG